MQITTFLPSANLTSFISWTHLVCIVRSQLIIEWTEWLHPVEFILFPLEWLNDMILVCANNFDKLKRMLVVKYSKFGNLNIKILAHCNFFLHVKYQFSYGSFYSPVWNRQRIMMFPPPNLLLNVFLLQFSPRILFSLLVMLWWRQRPWKRFALFSFAKKKETYHL